MKIKIFLLSIVLLLSLGCKDEVLPKPKAMLRLEFPKANYNRINNDCAFNFVKNELATITSKNSCSMVLDYPQMKGSIYLTYKKVENNIRDLLIDAQKLTYEHVEKADNIEPKEYVNTDKKVYGMFYEVAGNAASQSQFYVTDSINHFVAGSLYFYTKPNYDSIYPAANYLQNDIRTIMESLEWK